MRPLMLHQSFVRILGLAAALTLSLAPLGAQTVSFSIPDTTARKGDTLFIPITVSTLSATDSVYSGEWDLSFSSGVIEVFGIETAGTLTQSPVTAIYNTTTRAFAFASTDAMTGSGVFVYLKVRVLPQPNRDTTTIFQTNGLVNEGNPIFSATGGKLRVLGIQVSPKTPPSLLVVGGSLQFAVSGDQIPPLTWTLSSPTVGTISATGLFDALAPGQTKVHVEDSRGLKDSTNLFPIYPASAASLTISVPDTSFTQTLQFNMPVRISDVTGLGILSAQFAMTFSSTRLQAMDVVLEGSKAENWSKSFDISSGRIDVALAGTDTLAGSGVLVYVRMRVLPAASGASTVSFSEVIFNENLTASVQTGQFTPIAAPTVVVAPSTATVVREDTLQFSVTSGGTPPYVWSVSNPSVASIDEATGLFTANARGTTTVSVMDALGFVGTSGTILVNDVSVTLPDTGVWIADSADIPIFIDDVTGLDISSLQIRVVYDSSVVKFLSVETTGTLAASFAISYKDTLDTLRIAAAGALPMTGAGPLLKLRFGANTLPPGTAPLTLVQCFFNEPGPLTPTAKLESGSVTIYDAAGVPSLVSPAQSAAEIELDEPFVWNSGVAATVYWLQISTDPSFATTVINVAGMADTSAVVAGLAVNTTYHWRVSAGNGGGYSAFTPSRTFHTVLVTSVNIPTDGIPEEFQLAQNFPNPFNPSTNIRFGLPKESNVRVTAYDMAGNEVGSVFSGIRQAGVHQISFDGANLSSGVYFYRLVATPIGNSGQPIIRTMKMVLLK